MTYRDDQGVFGLLRNRQVPFTGGQLTEPLYLAGDPIHGREAATRDYVDTATDTGSWVNITGFTNSWTNHGASRVARYRKGTDGIVRLQGLIKGGVMGSAAFTLPAGFRHGAGGNLQYPVVSNDAFGAVYVGTAGNVVPYVGSNVYVDLSSIWFVAEA